MGEHPKRGHSCGYNDVEIGMRYYFDQLEFALQGRAIIFGVLMSTPLSMGCRKLSVNFLCDIERGLTLMKCRSLQFNSDIYFRS